jgi:hypothetical protein
MNSKPRLRLELYKWLIIVLMVAIALLGYNESLHKFSLFSKTNIAGNVITKPKDNPQGKIYCHSSIEAVMESDIYISGGQYSVLTVPPVKSISFDNTSTTALLSMNEKYEVLIYDSMDSTTSREFKNIFQSVHRFCSKTHSKTVVTEHGYPAIAATAITIIRIHILNASPMHSEEEYSLQISESAINIEAVSFKGALHGLSTLDQLLHSPIPMQLPVEITDFPDNSWRGRTTRHLFQHSWHMLPSYLPRSMLYITNCCHIISKMLISMWQQD